MFNHGKERKDISARAAYTFSLKKRLLATRLATSDPTAHKAIYVSPPGDLP